jgi:hypothetical protein
MMGFTALRCGGGMSGVFLKDGARVVGAQGGAVEDFARQVVRTTAQKVVGSAKKKFSRVTFNILDREISAWDYYCFGLLKSGSTFRDKLISDYLRLMLTRWINDMSDEMRWMIEMSAFNSADIEENDVLSRETVFAVIYAEIQTLAVDYGRLLQEFYEVRTTSAR